MPSLKAQIELLNLEINIIYKEIEHLNFLINYIEKARKTLKSPYSIELADKKIEEYKASIEKNKEEGKVLRRKLEKLESSNKPKQMG